MNEVRKIRIALFGTSDFAVPIFDSICSDTRFDVRAVITQPDKLIGRNQELTQSVVKEWSISKGILPLQPSNLKDAKFQETFNLSMVETALVVAYGKLIPESILDIPRFGFTNVHPSLLPKYRGPSPIQYAILKCERETGVSLMVLDKEVDHGPIIYQFAYNLNGNETYTELSDTLSRLSANIVCDKLSDFTRGIIRAREQKHDSASYTKLITSNDGELFFDKDAFSLHARVRALNPEPGTFLVINNKRLKIRKVSILDLKGKPNTFFVHDGCIAVYCEQQALLLEEVQPEGKKWMLGEDYARGYKF